MGGICFRGFIDFFWPVHICLCVGLFFNISKNNICCRYLFCQACTRASHCARACTHATRARQHPWCELGWAGGVCWRGYCLPPLHAPPRTQAHAASAHTARAPPARVLIREAGWEAPTLVKHEWCWGVWGASQSEGHCRCLLLLPPPQHPPYPLILLQPPCSSSPPNHPHPLTHHPTPILGANDQNWPARLGVLLDRASPLHPCIDARELRGWGEFSRLPWAAGPHTLFALYDSSSRIQPL
jgi:hypothetical protein